MARRTAKWLHFAANKFTCIADENIGSFGSNNVLNE